MGGTAPGGVGPRLGGSPETAMLLDGGEFGRISLKDRRLLQDALILGCDAFLHDGARAEAPRRRRPGAACNRAAHPPPTRLLDSALSQVPVLGEEIRSNIQGLRGSTSALVTGILGSLYGGTGVAQAGQNAMHTMWAVPIHRRPNPIGSRLKSLVAVLALGGGLVGTTGLSGLAASVEAGGLGWLGRVLGLVVALTGNSLLFLAGFRILTIERMPFRVLVPGALAAAVGWQVLQAVGGYYVTRTLTSASEVYGVFGLVLGLFAFLYAAALITLLCAEVNVVRPPAVAALAADPVHRRRAPLLARNTPMLPRHGPSVLVRHHIGQGHRSRRGAAPSLSRLAVRSDDGPR